MPPLWLSNFKVYLKDEKVDITRNSGIVKIILILGGLGFSRLGGMVLCNHYKNEKDNVENKY